jgi:hypothetical protein
MFAAVLQSAVYVGKSIADKNAEKERRSKG